MSEQSIGELLDTGRARAAAMAMEAMQEIFHRLPFGQKITFANGKVGVVKPFVQPRIAHRDMPSWPYEGCQECGFDITAEDGSWHLEFYIFRTGWGGMP